MRKIDLKSQLNMKVPDTQMASFTGKPKLLKAAKIDLERLRQQVL